eukprot:ANDGO_05770.mRNA.1 hypothetical protein
MSLARAFVGEFALCASWIVVSEIAAKEVSEHVQPEMVAPLSRVPVAMVVLMIVFSQLFPRDIVNPTLTFSLFATGRLKLAECLVRMAGQFAGLWAGCTVAYGTWKYPIILSSVTSVNELSAVNSEIVCSAIGMFIMMATGPSLGRAACLVNAPLNVQLGQIAKIAPTMNFLYPFAACLGRGSFAGFHPYVHFVAPLVGGILASLATVFISSAAVSKASKKQKSD